MTMVIESAVSGAVLLKRSASSLNQGPLALITGVMVTPPVPPPGSLTVRLTEVDLERPPPDAVMVTEAVPRVAVLEAERVSVLLAPVVEGGVKDAVTPLGSPEALKATDAVKPPVRVTVIVDVPLDPRLIARLGGDGEREKSGVGGALTVRLIVVVLVRLPPVPVIVTVAGPVVAVVDALNVRLLVEALVDDGLKLAVTPLGNPLALNATLPLNPPVRVIVMTLLPLAPRLIDRLAGFADSEKSGLLVVVGSP